MPITTPRHVLSRCVFIPNKFPTLLAEREIIANASLLVRISPRTDYKGTKKKLKTKEKGGNLSISTLKCIITTVCFLVLISP